jgi:hypothetical protein
VSGVVVVLFTPKEFTFCPSIVTDTIAYRMPFTPSPAKDCPLSECPVVDCAILILQLSNELGDKAIPLNSNNQNPSPILVADAVISVAELLYGFVISPVVKLNVLVHLLLLPPNTNVTKLYPLAFATTLIL